MRADDGVESARGAFLAFVADTVQRMTARRQAFLAPVATYFFAGEQDVFEMFSGFARTETDRIAARIREIVAQTRPAAVGVQVAFRQIGHPDQHYVIFLLFAPTEAAAIEVAGYHVNEKQFAITRASGLDFRDDLLITRNPFFPETRPAGPGGP